MDSSETFPHLSFRRADIKSQVMPDARISCVELSKGCIYINGGMHNTSAPSMNYPQDSDWWNCEDKIPLLDEKYGSVIGLFVGFQYYLSEPNLVDLV